MMLFVGQHRELILSILPWEQNIFPDISLCVHKFIFSDD